VEQPSDSRGLALRPYQTEAVAAILAEFATVRATLLVLATGLGKTVTFADVARIFVERGGKVLVLAHREELLTQAANTLRTFGLTVGIEQADQRVDPAVLPDVTIASVQTLQRKRLTRFPPDTFPLVIVDEAHHTTATTYRAILDYFAPAKVLGVTATPDRTDRTGLHNVYESLAYRMEIGAGIKGGWLAPIELRSVVVQDLDISSVRVTAGEMNAADLEAELMREQVLHQVAAPLAELARGRQTLVFTVGVEQAHALARVLGGYGVQAAAVDGSMGREARRGVLEAYRAGHVQVVCNAMLWTEGFDAPETSCIALVRPTSSRSLVTQMIGRGTRLHEGKSTCLVLDFVPGRAGKLRLSGPADVLAGEDLPDELLDRIQTMSSAEAGDLETLIGRARAQQAESEAAALNYEQRERLRVLGLVRQVGVAYAAPRHDVETLLSAMALDEAGADWAPDFRGAHGDSDGRGAGGGGLPRSPRMHGSRPATEAQRASLISAGFELPQNLNMREASALFQILDARREKGLCTLKQARLLQKHGLRDDVSMRDASEAITAIRNNGWRAPAWLYRDPRFSRQQELAS
jgi:superfamily II DNA or RNA helicase